MYLCSVEKQTAHLSIRYTKRNTVYWILIIERKQNYIMLKYLYEYFFWLKSEIERLSN
jgi:hypothetical protein